MSRSFDRRWFNYSAFSIWRASPVNESDLTMDFPGNSNRRFMDELLSTENDIFDADQRAELRELYHWNESDPDRGFPLRDPPQPESLVSIAATEVDWGNFDLSRHIQGRLYAGDPTQIDCDEAVYQYIRSPNCARYSTQLPTKLRQQEKDSCEVLAKVMKRCQESAAKPDTMKPDTSEDTCGSPSCAHRNNQPMMRTCADCHRSLPRTSFTANQWAKGDGLSRCVSCVHGHHSDVPSAGQSNSGRYNKSSRATFQYDDLLNPFAQGAFRWVAEGEYTSGPRRGEACVAKWFKTGAVFSQDYFTLDIKATDKALEIVNVFNQMRLVNKTVKINVPEVWTFDDQCSDDWAGRKCLQEPFIHNYQKFNSNSGWTDDSEAWGEVMQALSHFSYHLSGGNYVLCDLQGGIYRHKVVLSDPVILSRNREYGVTDLGSDGISSFFSQHNCNDFCRPNWTQPANPARYFRPVPGTTMIRRSVQTRSSRPARTRDY
ncbi:hypothetical protein L249_6881 [Ophiocordyceps polyrhachis-furcata BCC 54312]|uniref:Alpha-type protein kinase domain-containing protein n=1 Tax=Ophiocordyceps polyrhachis-furcata BCC 54312 TaxID=1330021 RepID=A0A367LLN7_9HYPO|nr:hypothetical protein L249_6881 [Ophiocordyceps polyrhachis-furcata BCC 54312]